MTEKTDFVAAEKRDLKALGCAALILIAACALSLIEPDMQEPPFWFLVQLTGLLLFIPVIVRLMRILKRGTPAIIALAAIQLVISGGLALVAIKLVLRL